jgi:hypothetical protein
MEAWHINPLKTKKNKNQHKNKNVKNLMNANVFAQARPNPLAGKKKGGMKSRKQRQKKSKRTRKH